MSFLLISYLPHNVDQVFCVQVGFYWNFYNNIIIKQVIFACIDDTSPVKLNLTVGAYRNEVSFRIFIVSIIKLTRVQVLIKLVLLLFLKEGKPQVLDVVRRAEQLLSNDL